MKTPYEHVTVSWLQEYLKGKDSSARDEDYLLKLCEETGELVHAFIHNPPPATDEQFKGSVEEELWDVIYYVLCLANSRGIDLEHWIAVKEAYNNARYNPDTVYAPPHLTTTAPEEKKS